jgi:hypothetical protein
MRAYHRAIFAAARGRADVRFGFSSAPGSASQVWHPGPCATVSHRRGRGTNVLKPVHRRGVSAPARVLNWVVAVATTVVEHSGIEPLTSWVRSRRSPS